MRLQQDSVVIRPLRAEDATSLYQAVRESIPEVSRWLPWCHENYSIDESREWIARQLEAWKKGTEYSFCIIDRKNGEFAGGVGINQINRAHNFANLGYWVKTAKAGKGMATTATKLAAVFGFRKLKFTRLEILTALENGASRRVAEKAGAKREGILRNRLLFHQRPLDAILFALIPGDMPGMGF